MDNYLVIAFDNKLKRQHLQYHKPNPVAAVMDISMECKLLGLKVSWLFNSDSHTDYTSIVPDDVRFIGKEPPIVVTI